MKVLEYTRVFIPPFYPQLNIQSKLHSSHNPLSDPNTAWMSPSSPCPSGKNLKQSEQVVVLLLNECSNIMNCLIIHDVCTPRLLDLY